ncbi:hypothetical protein TNCV_4720541 [Trichonephila clavipes]|uniref:Uncharacterized protein n=1 Tax=Trichonephila clavipes TaxID=2585209 RepID=A0A8X6W611_TRICX|nr:hypothetical protein TNCV_4720541 [Trichonephila clavipes]
MCSQRKQSNATLRSFDIHPTLSHLATTTWRSRGVKQRHMRFTMAASESKDDLCNSETRGKNEIPDEKANAGCAIPE